MKEQMIRQFHTRVDRSGSGSLKDRLTPEALKARDLIYYWGAEFEFPTCPAFSEGVAQCARRGMFGFTLPDDAYCQRVVWWMQRMRGWEIQPDWILPTQGTIFAVSTAIHAFVGPGEQLVILTPTYNRYQQAADRNGRQTVCSPLRYQPDAQGELRYSIDFADLEKKLADPRSRLLVFCNPCNPTGTIFDEASLKEIARLSDTYQVPVFSDEIFAEVVLEEGTRVVPYVEAAGEDSLAMTCTSLGKCMSLTGVNHANLIIANRALRERYDHQRLADHYGSLDPMLYAGLLNACTEAGAEFVMELRQIVRQNAETIKAVLEEYLPGTKVTLPQGTFVLWVNYHGLGLDDQTLDTFLNEEAFFCGDTGCDYYADSQFYRYSIAAPPEAVARSMDYLKKAAIAHGFHT